MPTRSLSAEYADIDYWVGYPDRGGWSTRAAGADLDAVLAEVRRWTVERCGTVLPAVASTFEQWSATPLGVFAGVMETDAVVDPQQESVHTAGRTSAATWRTSMRC